MKLFIQQQQVQKHEPMSLHSGKANQNNFSLVLSICFLVANYSLIVENSYLEKRGIEKQAKRKKICCFHYLKGLLLLMNLLEKPALPCHMAR